MLILKTTGYIAEVHYKKPKDCTQYPFNLNVLHTLDTINLDGNVTFFVGENGSGKSTLIEAIAIAYGFNAEGGSINYNFSTRNSSSNLFESLLLTKTYKKPKDGFFLRAESFYNVATQIEAMDSIPAAAPKIIASYGGKSLHEQSHGESFLCLMNERFRGNGLYILDEPEAALSGDRQLSFLLRLHELVLANSQFIIATHSPVLLSYPNATIYSIESSGIEKRKYEETTPYQFYKMFMDDYKRVLHNLLQ